VEAGAALARLGGTADAGPLLALTTRRALRRAVREGEVLRVTRGRYVLPAADAARRKATELSACVAGRSAAAHYGWALKDAPQVPELALSPRRNIPADRRKGARILWTNLAPDQVRGGVTTPLRTVIDCARRLPFDEALAIADSALRSGLVAEEELKAVRVRGAGAAAVHRVIRYADGKAANPFESVLRALCIEAGLDVEAQASLDLGTGTIHPDLVDFGRRCAFEADSWSHHATRKGHRRDCVRYNLLSLHGWRVFRFTWEQVMHEQAYVRWVLGIIARSVEQEESCALFDLLA
jgi:very-short-patch-repair endonuclease